MSANVYTFGIERRGETFFFFLTLIFVALTKSLVSKKIMVCLSEFNIHAFFNKD